MQEKLQFDSRKSLINDGNRTILVLKSGENSILPYQVNMLQYNKIEGLLPMQFYIEDTQYKYFYDVTALTNMALGMDYKKYDIAMIRTILTSLYKTVLQMENYLLDASSIILIPEYIFTDRNQEKIRFIYYPDKKSSFQESLELLMEYFINHISYEDNRTVNMVYEMYQRIKQGKEPLGKVLNSFCLLEENDSEALSESEEENFEEWKHEIEDNQKNQDQTSDQYDNKRKIPKKILTGVIDLLGASGTAALVLYMMRNHEKMSGAGFFLWFLSVSAVLFGSSFIAWRVSESNNMINKKTSEEEAETSFSEAADSSVRREKDSGISECKSSVNRIASFNNNAEQEEMIASDGANSGNNWKESEEHNDKKYCIYDDMDQDFDFENQFEEMSFDAVESENIRNRNNNIPKTKKLSVREKIPATIIMKEAEETYQIGVFCSLQKEKSMNFVILEEDDLLVGKLPGVVDVCLDRETVSRIHAEIGCEDGKFYITDQGSTNGTYVNGLRIRKNYIRYLKEGDIVRIADIEYQFHIKCPENDTQTVGIGV